MSPRAGARDAAASLLDTKSRLRAVTVTLDEDLETIRERNRIAVARAGGLKSIKAAVRAEVEATVNAQMAALTQRAEGAEAQVCDLTNQLRRRPATSADATLRAANKDLTRRLAEAQKRIAATASRTKQRR